MIEVFCPKDVTLTDAQILSFWEMMFAPDQTEWDYEDTSTSAQKPPDQVLHFFRETLVGRLQRGDQAVVTLMSYPDSPLQGRVDSIGWGIAQDDGSTGQDLLPTISPTFEWIRLAQRVPVRIHLETIPDGVRLRAGTTASVLVRTGTSGSDTMGATTAAPKLLQ